jgi:hypothetical protein
VLHTLTRAKVRDWGDRDEEPEWCYEAERALFVGFDNKGTSATLGAALGRDSGPLVISTQTAQEPRFPDSGAGSLRIVAFDFGAIVLKTVCACKAIEASLPTSARHALRITWELPG